MSIRPMDHGPPIEAAAGLRPKCCSFPEAIQLLGMMISISLCCMLNQALKCRTGVLRASYLEKCPEFRTALPGDQVRQRMLNAMVVLPQQGIQGIVQVHGLGG